MKYPYLYIHLYIYSYLYIYVCVCVYVCECVCLCVCIGGDYEFIIHVFYWWISLDHEIYTKCKKSSNLIKGIFSHNIFSEIESEQVKKTFVIQNQKLLIFLRIPLPHFIKSLLTIQFQACF